MSLVSFILAAGAAPKEVAEHAATHAVATGQFDLLVMVLGLLSCASIIAGLFFVLAGTIGVLRLPDFYARLHAAGMTDTLGVELILLGLIIQSGFTQMSLKLLMVAFFLLLTSPTATHALSNAAYKAGLKPLRGKYRVPETDEILSLKEGKN